MPSKAKVHSILEGRQQRDSQSPTKQQNQNQPPAQKSATSVNPTEPEDKKATGTSGALQNEVLRHNFRGGQAQPHPATTAGQHATGSFPTGAAKNSKK
jgi:hypothetical protein